MSKNNIGFLQGLIAGLVVLVISIIVYAISPLWFLKLWYIKIFVIIGFMVYCLYLYKKANNDVLPFQAGLKHSYAVWVVGFAIWFAFKFTLFNLIDPGLIKVKHDLEIQFAQNVAPDDKKAAMEKNLDQPNISQNRIFMLEAGTTIIVGFFYALIIAGAYSITNKKPEPGELNVNDQSESNT